MDKKVTVTYDALKAASEALITDYIFKHSLEVPENLKAEIEAICDSIIKTVVKKNADYGDAWQRYGMFTGLIRENDKLLRVETLADGRQALVADEKVGDTLVDIVGYGLLLKLWLDSQEPVTKPIEWVTNANLRWGDGTASVGVDYSRDGDTTVYRVGNRIYTQEEFEQLRPNRQPELPFAATEEEGVIHEIVKTDKAEHAIKVVEDKKIYKDNLTWIQSDGGMANVGSFAHVSIDTIEFIVSDDHEWRVDESGRNFLYETDFLIEWNDPTDDDGKAGSQEPGE
jgi:hypothetical protein